MPITSLQVASTITRFPFVLTYGVKSHLRPQLAYLASLGFEPQELRALVLARPQVLVRPPVTFS